VTAPYEWDRRECEEASWTDVARGSAAEASMPRGTGGGCQPRSVRGQRADQGVQIQSVEIGGRFRLYWPEVLGRLRAHAKLR
jgi:hypothetical protein